MNPGDLDARIRVYKLEKSKDELGKQHPKETLLKTIWAKVEPRTGSLLTGRPAGTMLSKTTHAITVRAVQVQDITVDCRIRWTDAAGNDHRFDINYIMPPARGNSTTTIYAEEKV